MPAEGSGQTPSEEAPASQLNARTKIIEILTRVETRHAFSDKLLEREAERFSPEDRGLITEVVNGVLRWQYRLDWYLCNLYVGEYDNLIPDVKNNLRSAVYQLMYLDRVPAYAVLNEAVEISKKKFNQKTANLVNAILRNFLRQQKKLEYLEMQLEYVEKLCVSLSHPHWMLQRWIERWGIDDTVALCRANNERPRIYIRANRLKMRPETLCEQLDEAAVAYERHPDFPEFLWIKDFSEFRKLDLLRRGAVVVQDVSTGIPVRLLNPQPGEAILDACAAPGGKSAYIVELMENQGVLVALEKHHTRARILNENFERLGINLARVICANAQNLPLAMKFDKILLDAPCSGLGVLSKRVDLKWKRSMADIETMKDLQLSLLESVAKALKENGRIVYSTCTIEPEENEEVIEAFLRRNPGFELENLRNELPARYLWEKNTVRTFPHRHYMDGSFAARLRLK